VILIRHCRSAQNAATSPATWGLTAEGHRQAVALASSPWLENASTLVAGPEPKMTDTLHPTATALATELMIDDAFRETDARWLEYDEFLACVARMFELPGAVPSPGWECSADAGNRLLAAISRHREAGVDGDLAVCSGGRALTSLLLSLALIAPDRAFAHWQAITMPAIAVVDIPRQGAAPTVVRHFADWA
jgi:broad specificity phosphatase PhoE